jgi:hypothetical protein
MLDLHAWEGQQLHHRRHRLGHRAIFFVEPLLKNGGDHVLPVRAERLALCNGQLMPRAAATWGLTAADLAREQHRAC